MENMTGSVLKLNTATIRTHLQRSFEFSRGVTMRFPTEPLVT